MKSRASALVTLFVSILFVMIPCRVWAFNIDQKATFQLSGKLQTRATFRLNDAAGFTFPDVPAGNLVQQRNLALMEVNHDLSELTRDWVFSIRSRPSRSRLSIIW